MTHLLAAALVLLAVPAIAQTRTRGAAEVAAGYAGVVDDATIDHGVVGGRARIYLSPRVSIGPELVHMRGPREDSLLYLTGNLTYDVLAPRTDRRVNLFVVAGGGFFRGVTHIGPQRFTNVEGAVTGGGGVRIGLSDRVYVLGEYRIGWEPHQRLTGGIGVHW